MGDVVNLNQFRKQRSRGTSQKRASENRVKFGRTKTDKSRQAHDAVRADRELDGKLIDKPQIEQPSSPEDAPKAR